MANDPIHQFQIRELFTLGEVGGHKIQFTNSTLFMVVNVVLVVGFLYLATSKKSLVPGRTQSVAESEVRKAAKGESSRLMMGRARMSAPSR